MADIVTIDIGAGDFPFQVMVMPYAKGKEWQMDQVRAFSTWIGEPVLVPVGIEEEMVVVTSEGIWNVEMDFDAYLESVMILTPESRARLKAA